MQYLTPQLSNRPSTSGNPGGHGRNRIAQAFRERVKSQNSGSRFKARVYQKAVDLNPRMGETHNIGGFHSGFLSGKATKPYALIASGAVLSERETTSVGPTQADTGEFRSMA